MAKAEWAGFVNIKLRDEHKEAIKKLAAAKDADKKLLDDVWTLVDSGYAVSVSPDPENGSMIATITGKDTGCENPGLAMSQRHSDARIALFAVLFAHYELARGGDWENAVDNGHYWDW